MRSKSGGSANLTTMYVDMSSADLEEKRIYGSAGDEENAPYTLYARPMKRYSHSNTISIPAKMSGQAEAPIATFSKTPDFVLKTWNQVTLPALTVTDPLYRIAYTWNLAHHIWKGGALKFNDLTAQEYDSAMLDMLSQYREKHAMSSLYQKMIGNTKELQTFSGELPAATVKLPTPFFYGRHPSFALPLCAAHLNDVYEEYDVETDLSKLIRVQKNMAATPGTDPDDWQDVKAKTVDFSSILSVAGGKPFEVPMTKTWVKYAAITDEEREDFTEEKMYVYIERFQAQNGKKAGPGEHRLEFHMNGPVTHLFFNFANVTSAEYNNHSNYSDTVATSSAAADPLEKATLAYESESRFEDVPGDHFDMDTYMSGERAPSEIGYHMLSYGEHVNDLTPTHSANYSNLVTTFEADVAEKSSEDNTYMLVLRAISLRRVRYKSGIFGIPPASEE